MNWRKPYIWRVGHIEGDMKILEQTEVLANALAEYSTCKRFNIPDATELTETFGGRFYEERLLG